MKEFFESFFCDEKIEYYRSCEISGDFIASPRKLPDRAAWVTAFLIPYRFIPLSAGRTVSHYAVARDYHYYVKELAKRLDDRLCKSNKNIKAAFFADNSPFYERTLALKLGLGFAGKNGMLINEKYGSFVFLGELVTDFPLRLSAGNFEKRKSCSSCGKCLKACPTGCLSEKFNSESVCLSALTQQKKTNESENAQIAAHYLSWGCDICQEVCPHNADASDTPIPFFRKELLPKPTVKELEAMSDGDFEQRAYSWRGKNTILRNLRLHEK